jgi:enamine deaminase RidA (YjgF/YER057c/UK114 family)
MGTIIIADNAQGRRMKKEYQNPPALSRPGAYTHVVSAAGAGTIVYVSGQVSFGVDGAVVGKGDMRAQSEQVFKNVTNALKAAGAKWDDVVKVNGYMVDMNPRNLSAYREVRAGFLKQGRLPASTLVGVSRLVEDDLLLEVEVVALLDASKPPARAKAKAKKNKR